VKIGDPIPLYEGRWSVIRKMAGPWPKIAVIEDIFEHPDTGTPTTLLHLPEERIKFLLPITDVEKLRKPPTTKENPDHA